MATKKAVPVKSAPARKTVPIKLSASRELQPWEAEMAAEAKAAAKAEQLTGLKVIKTRGGVMKIDDEIVEGNAIRCIILASLHENQFFTSAFDPDTPAPPACYAFGDPTREKPEDGMAPHEKSTDKQSELCANCWANQMGSADVGRGKACRNVRRLALVTEDALEDLSGADIRLLKVPVMSTQGWSKYVHQLSDDMQRKCWGVVTEVSVVPDDKSQFRINFEFQELVNFDQDLYEQMKKKAGAAMQMLQAPYPDFTEEEKPARGRGGRGAPPAQQRGRPAPVKKAPATKKAKY